MVHTILFRLVAKRKKKKKSTVQNSKRKSTKIIILMKLSDYYTDKELIYNSAISDIYKAIDKSNKSPVCLKIVDEDFSLPPHSIHREILILKNLKSHSHPNIIEYINDLKVYDDIILVTKLYRYNLTQLMESSKYCKRTTRFIYETDTDTNGVVNKYILSNRIEETDIKLWLKSMSSGLEFIHSQQIIHRDIKPSNIFFILDDITQPIIGDFGICYDLKSPPKDEPIMEKYIDVSTGIYKAPELILGITNYEYEIDIWSLSIILTILYSKDFQSILIKNDKEIMINDSHISDLYLLNQIFQNFGTPNLIDCNNELFCDEYNHENLHFKKFNLQNYSRKQWDIILPRCNDELMKEIFTKMIKYDRSQRITSKEIFQLILD